MSIRKIGRWLYHLVTSSDKRPYIKLSLPELNEEITRAAAYKEVFRLLGLFDELTYRVTAPTQRESLKQRICGLILRFENEILPIDSSREEIEVLRNKLLQKYADAQAVELEAKRKAHEARVRLAAEEKARKEAEALAKRKKERLAAEEKARLAAEAEAKRAAEEKAQQEAEKARLEAVAQAQREAEEQAKREAEQEQARLAAEEKARKEAEALAKRKKERLAAEEKARLAAEAEAKRAAEEKAQQEAEKARLEAAAQAQREAEEQAKQEAEQEQARLAAEEKARKEAEALAKREAAAAAKRKKERLAAEEKARLAAEAEAKRAAEEKAQQEAEKARLEAAAQAQREAEEQAKREAEQEQARLAAEEKARREAEANQLALERRRIGDYQTRLNDKAQRARLEEEARRLDLAEQIERFKQARPLSPLKTIGDNEESGVYENANPQPGAQSTELAKQARQPEEAKGSRSKESELFTPQETEEEYQQYDCGKSEDKTSPETEIPEKETPKKETAISSRIKKQREERRELARLRKLEREGKTEVEPQEELSQLDVEDNFEEAEAFSPYLRSVPEHWSDWSEQHWNIKLLEYCFVQKASESSSQGIPSTEEDLAFITGDRESQPAELAKALVDRVREASLSHGLSPARLLIKRLEIWDHTSPSPPRFFAFLWTTCLIAQGFPSPFEQGEFHKRYEREEVYGANESQYLRSNLPAAWVHLSKWLDRDDIFDGEGHRRLILPSTDPRRSIISHSWKLSFPCRSDRRRLHDVLRSNRTEGTSRESNDIRLISKIYYQGGFTPEFTAALKQQIDLVQKGKKAEEWFSAIIHREIEAQGPSQDQSASKAKSKGLTSISPKIMLHLDDEDCYLELVLPSQSVAIEKPRRLSHKTYCTVTLETKDRMPQVVREIDIDDKLEDLVIPDIQVKIDVEQDEYVLKLRHEGLDNAILAEWSCTGLMKSTHYILFDSETNEVITDRVLNGSSLSILFRRNWDVILSGGIEAESEDPISVSRLGGWHLLLLAKTSPLEKLETISLANATGEKLDICWADSGIGKSNIRPILKGLGLPGQATGFVMLAENPEVWLPPGIADIQIEMFKVEDDEFYMPIGSLQVPSTESWQQAGVRKLVTCPGLYSVRLSYFDNSSARIRKWSRHIMIAEESNISCLQPAPLQASYRYKESSRVLDLERDVSPFIFHESQEFWNATWLINGLWPHERIRVHLAGDGEDYSQLLLASSTGSCEIPISTFEPYLLSRESARLSIQRQGFICEYEMAVLNGIPARIDQQLAPDPALPTTTPTKRTDQKRRPVNTLEFVVYGIRSEKVQDMLVAEIEELLEDGFAYLDRRTMEYPDTRRAPGRRFVFHRISFDSLDNKEKEVLHTEIDSLIRSTVERSGLDFRAEWSRRRE